MCRDPVFHTLCAEKTEDNLGCPGGIRPSRMRVSDVTATNAKGWRHARCREPLACSDQGTSNCTLTPRKELFEEDVWQFVV
jgi:hypothetical protein